MPKRKIAHKALVPKPSKRDVYKYYFLVFEDHADLSTEITVPEATAKTGHTHMGPTTIVYAQNALEAVEYCARKGLFKITGESRLVAARILGFYGCLVSEKTEPRPFDVDGPDAAYVEE